MSHRASGEKADNRHDGYDGYSANPKLNWEQRVHH